MGFTLAIFASGSSSSPDRPGPARWSRRHGGAGRLRAHRSGPDRPCRPDRHARLPGDRIADRDHLAPAPARPQHAGADDPGPPRARAGAHPAAARPARPAQPEDPLTGLANRRRWDAELASACTGAREGGGLVALLLLDLDHFKRINDAHGHPGGDEVLRRVAGLLSGGVRGGDLVARLGGDEFAVLMPGATEDRAIALAEEMRFAVAALRIDGFAPGEVSLSVGVAVAGGRDCLPAGTAVPRRRAALPCQDHPERRRRPHPGALIVRADSTAGDPGAARRGGVPAPGSGGYGAHARARGAHTSRPAARPRIGEDE